MTLEDPGLVEVKVSGLSAIRAIKNEFKALLLKVYFKAGEKCRVYHMPILSLT
jgi:hypothetical protein